ncbi:MAG: TRIC cation channel family protein [Clostridia bacterium]|nr:TRIC cation channel family protein [Clostridia bacterium]
MDELYALALELLGTAAFAVSGALTAVNKKMDVLGVMILGLTTATGGGIIRDLVLGYTPPAAFRNPIYSLVALITSLIIFLPPVRKSIGRHASAFNNVLTVVDAIGLGVFTVIGIQAAHSETNAHGIYLYLFVGVVTGVGGGVLRDIFAGEKPSIFVEHIYATASILGAAVCIILWEPAGRYVAMFAGLVLVVVLRVLAAFNRWNLPKAE